jgi:hypothetical protein
MQIRVFCDFAFIKFHCFDIGGNMADKRKYYIELTLN